MNNTPIQEVFEHKHLGLIFDTSCQWKSHIDYILEKASNKLKLLRALKFQIDRKSLQTMYFSFIRPVIEYSDIVWDNCTQTLKEKLEKINIEAARIVTGATKLTSLKLLYKESGWPTLEKRREEHKLLQYFKMVKSLTPEYLSSLVPEQHHNIHNYNTRNAQDYVHLRTHSTHYYNSFLPSCVRLWNNLPPNIKEMTSIVSFKKAISSNTPEVPKYYYAGTRLGQILHARLRMNCSSLKQHLYEKNIEPNPYCQCNQVESTFHFLLSCKLYDAQRKLLERQIDHPLTLDLLLYGNPNLPYTENKNIFISVQKFIINSKRFT